MTSRPNHTSPKNCIKIIHVDFGASGEKLWKKNIVELVVKDLEYKYKTKS